MTTAESSGVFVMVDGVAPFAPVSEIKEWLDAARKLPQTDEVKYEVERAEYLLRARRENVIARETQ